MSALSLSLAEREAAATRLSYRLAMDKVGLLSMAESEAAEWTPLEMVKMSREAKLNGSTHESVADLANTLGKDIPYHREWYKDYPARIIGYGLFTMTDAIHHDVRRYEKLYPQFFSAISYDATGGGYQVIYDLLVEARQEQRELFRHERAVLQEKAERLNASGLNVAIASLGLMVTPADAHFHIEPPYDVSDITYKLDEADEAPETGAALEWGGNKTDLVELAYALIESGLLKVPNGRAKTIATLGRLFGLKITKPERLLQNIKRRQPGLTTQLLDRAKVALMRLLG